MSDLISREDAVNEIHKYFFEEINKIPCTKDEDGYEVYTDMPTVNSLFVCNKELSKRIKALLSAEAVEVVRCKDCKHRDEKCGMGEHRWCEILEMSTAPNDFCSCGECKEESEVKE